MGRIRGELHETRRVFSFGLVQKLFFSNGLFFPEMASPSLSPLRHVLGAAHNTSDVLVLFQGVSRSPDVTGCLRAGETIAAAAPNPQFFPLFNHNCKICVAAVQPCGWNTANLVVSPPLDSAAQLYFECVH